MLQTATHFKIFTDAHLCSSPHRLREPFATVTIAMVHLAAVFLTLTTTDYTSVKVVRTKALGSCCLSL